MQNIGSYDVTIDPVVPTIIERWVFGCSVVTGVFPQKVVELSVFDMKSRIPRLYKETRLKRRTKWPRGVCCYYIVPIYVADTFDPAVVAWAHAYHNYRWAIHHEPVLYDKKCNHAELCLEYNLKGAVYKAHVNNIIIVALEAISRYYGNGFPRAINGKLTDNAGTD